MKNPLVCSALLAALMCVSGGAQASLWGRDIDGNAVPGSDASFLYDDVLRVTWLRDANHAQTTEYSGADADGRMTWAAAKFWAAGLNIGGFNGWRLPTMIDTASAGCDFAYSGTDCGYNVQTKSGNKTQYQAGQTVYSEMASLWYDTLGNKAYYNTSGAEEPNWGGLTNSGDFLNLQPYLYWSDLENARYRDFAWLFGPYMGGQSYDLKTESLYALAVRPGDVLNTSVVPASAVPIPAAAWLMASGLGAFGLAARKRRAKAA